MHRSGSSSVTGGSGAFGSRLCSSRRSGAGWGRYDIMDKRALVITCLLVATCGLCTCLSPIAAVFVDAELGLFRIANRLGIEPRLSAVHEYLDSTIVIGMPRERVHQEFNRIGPTTFSKRAPSMPLCERAVLRLD